MWLRAVFGINTGSFFPLSLLSLLLPFSGNLNGLTGYTCAPVSWGGDWWRGTDQGALTQLEPVGGRQRRWREGEGQRSLSRSMMDGHFPELTSVTTTHWVVVNWGQPSSHWVFFCIFPLKRRYWIASAATGRREICLCGTAMAVTSSAVLRIPVRLAIHAVTEQETGRDFILSLAHGLQKNVTLFFSVFFFHFLCELGGWGHVVRPLKLNRHYPTLKRGGHSFYMTLSLFICSVWELGFIW